MSVAGSTAQRSTQHHTTTQHTSRRDVSDNIEWLEIEIVRDEHYRQNGVYCSWQDILAGEPLASPGSANPRHGGDCSSG